MSEPHSDKETVFVDASRLDLEALLSNSDSPLLESMRRIATEADGDAIAGFSDGIS